MRKKKSFKSIVSIALTLSLFISSVLPAAAKDSSNISELTEDTVVTAEMIAEARQKEIPSVPLMINDKTDENYNEAFAQLEETFPNADISVGEDGSINVVTDVPLNSNMTRASSIYAQYGGSFRNYVKPSWWTSAMGIPYSSVFLNAGETNAILAAIIEPSLIDYILAIAEGNTISNIIKRVSSKFGIVLTVYGVALLLGVTYSAIKWIDEQACRKAAQNSTKGGAISFVRLVTNGYPTNIYSPWNSDYVTASPYDDFHPTFYPGEYGFD